MKRAVEWVIVKKHLLKKCSDRLLQSIKFYFFCKWKGLKCIFSVNERDFCHLCSASKHGITAIKATVH